MFFLSSCKQGFSVSSGQIDGGLLVKDETVVKTEPEIIVSTPEVSTQHFLWVVNEVPIFLVEDGNASVTFGLLVASDYDAE